ncbi:PP2C family protein-serine/threonine phosphatase [Paenibacillus sp. MY03]|uniref:PP2C family protein-serine/threonine phosphatase n=1 Tax=Paenibacillus sp. MY03 TaxID=302980 RepID=UPI0015C5E355|nr:PP2C family protein-serine/threonine phosphatase [Paenibacillus sp. MY03]
MRRSSNKADLLPLRLFGAYIAVFIGGTLFITINNLVIHGIAFEQLLKFNIPFLIISDIFLAFLLYAITYWRLGAVFRSFRRLGADLPKQVVFEKLMRFPGELSGGMILLALAFIALHHGIEIVSLQRRVDSWEHVVHLAQSVLSEVSLALILAVLLFVMTRRWLRSYAARLAMDKLPANRKHSAVRLLTLGAIIGFIITFSAAIRILPKAEEGWSAMSILGLPALYAVFSTSILAFYALELRKELRLLIDGLRKLADGEKSSLHRTFPVLSVHEVGRLASAVNEIQTRIGQSYLEVERQLRLAYAVQQKLLPKRLAVTPEFDIAASCQQCHEVGGDWYDVIPLGEHRYCIAIGDVSGKGMPAALLMSAAMTGLRTVVAQGGTAGDMLGRLNLYMYQMTRGRMYTTAGLAILDVSAASLEYAAAGHLDPYWIRQGELIDWPCSSLPLGMFPDTAYHGASRAWAPGDMFLLYTDGIIESGQAAGDMLGFERWEQELRRLSPERHAEDQLQALLGRLEHSEHEGELHDDRTVILLRWKGRL